MDSLLLIPARAGLHLQSCSLAVHKSACSHANLVSPTTKPTAKPRGSPCFTLDVTDRRHASEQDLRVPSHAIQPSFPISTRHKIIYLHKTDYQKPQQLSQFGFTSDQNDRSTCPRRHRRQGKSHLYPSPSLCPPTNIACPQGGAKAVTSTVGNTVGGVTNTVGGVLGATLRGVGETVEGATGLRSVGKGLADVGNGLEAGANDVARGVKNAGEWKS
jgi:hypothetical protein